MQKQTDALLRSHLLLLHPSIYPGISHYFVGTLFLNLSISSQTYVHNAVCLCTQGKGSRWLVFGIMIVLCLNCCRFPVENKLMGPSIHEQSCCCDCVGCELSLCIGPWLEKDVISSLLEPLAPSLLLSPCHNVQIRAFMASGIPAEVPISRGERRRDLWLVKESRWVIAQWCSRMIWNLCSFILLSDSIGGSFPASSHRCHHKQKHCLPIPQCGALSITPLLFHPHTKGSQIVMDTTQKAVKRQASFCNAITFSNRPIVIYEQVRLKVSNWYLPLLAW